MATPNGAIGFDVERTVTGPDFINDYIVDLIRPAFVVAKLTLVNILADGEVVGPPTGIGARGFLQTSVDNFATGTIFDGSDLPNPLQVDAQNFLSSEGDYLWYVAQAYRYINLQSRILQEPDATVYAGVNNPRFVVRWEGLAA